MRMKNLICLLLAAVLLTGDGRMIASQCYRHEEEEAE